MSDFGPFYTDDNGVVRQLPKGYNVDVTGESGDGLIENNVPNPEPANVSEHRDLNYGVDDEVDPAG